MKNLFLVISCFFTLTAFLVVAQKSKTKFTIVETVRGSSIVTQNELFGVAIYGTDLKVPIDFVTYQIKKADTGMNDLIFFISQKGLTCIYNPISLNLDCTNLKVKNSIVGKEHHFCFLLLENDKWIQYNTVNSKLDPEEYDEIKILGQQSAEGYSPAGTTQFSFYSKKVMGK